MWLVSTELDGTEVDFFSSLHMRTLRQSSYVICQGHKATQWQNHCLNPDSLTLEHTRLTLTFP